MPARGAWHAPPRPARRARDEATRAREEAREEAGPCGQAGSQTRRPACVAGVAEEALPVGLALSGAHDVAKRVADGHEAAAEKAKDDDKSDNE
jgi:hypothetical protein